jgi:hypothetical protein
MYYFDSALTKGHIWDYNDWEKGRRVFSPLVKKKLFCSGTPKRKEVRDKDT